MGIPFPLFQLGHPRNQFAVKKYYLKFQKSCAPPYLPYFDANCGLPQGVKMLSRRVLVKKQLESKIEYQIAEYLFCFFPCGNLFLNAIHIHLFTSFFGQNEGFSIYLNCLVNFVFSFKYLCFFS